MHLPIGRATRRGAAVTPVPDQRDVHAPAGAAIEEADIRPRGARVVGR